MTGKITFTVAPTRSGKSTFAKVWLAEGKNDRVVVNADAIRLALHGKDFDKRFEGTVHFIKENMIKAHLLDGMQVLVDETNTNRWTITSLLRLDENATPVYIYSTREQCIDRAVKTGKIYLVERGVIDRHFNNLEKLVRKYCNSDELNQKNIEKVVQGIKQKGLI